MSSFIKTVFKVIYYFAFCQIAAVQEKLHFMLMPTQPVTSKSRYRLVILAGWWESTKNEQHVA